MNLEVKARLIEKLRGITYPLAEHGAFSEAVLQVKEQYYPNFVGTGPDLLGCSEEFWVEMFLAGIFYHSPTELIQYLENESLECPIDKEPKI